MTSFTISHYHRDRKRGFVIGREDPRLDNWPVVYVLEDAKQIYVGESLNVRNRLFQHLKSSEKQGLTEAHVVVDSTFNKSAALDLESNLVRLLAGDGKYKVLNRNVGIVDAEYFNREQYRKKFEQIFEKFRDFGIFTRSVREIENSDLFKLSPFKALNPEQEITVQRLIEDLVASLRSKAPSTSVIQGDPGTGKTVVGVYLMKLLKDLGEAKAYEETDGDSVFADPVIAENSGLFEGLRIGLVVPQQALRESIRRVFAKTPGLAKAMVLTPFDVGASEQRFDLLIVDETHRLNRRTNQPSAQQNKRFAQINKQLFGANGTARTQLDWIIQQSDHQVFLLDAAQSVRPADLPPVVLNSLAAEAEAGGRFYPLSSQMRVRGDEDYVRYVRAIFSDDPPSPRAFSEYDLRWFEDLGQLESALAEQERRHGLARMIAGYAWKWVSKKNKSAYDIEIDGVRRRWNTTVKDWVQSEGAAGEVGSIHTTQGYDLNYAGVIIGSDLRYDTDAKQFFVDRTNYFDVKGKENSPSFDVTCTDEDLLQYVINIYVVLLTRGIRGTFVYVCDPGLRGYLRQFF